MNSQYGSDLPRMHSVKGFNIIELMMVVLIISIISAIAYPSFTAQAQKSRRSDGQVMLMEVMAAQERFYSQNNRYTTNLTELGYAATPESEKGFYAIDAAACGTLPMTACVNLTAAVVAGEAQQGTSNMTMNSRNEKTPTDYWE